MRLLIISDMPHYLRDGRIVAWGPTTQEIDALASLFDEVIHIATLLNSPPPRSAIPAQSTNIQLIPLPPTGGPTIRDKIGILASWPNQAKTLWREIKLADAVHVRCPASLSLLALIILACLQTPDRRWVKYAGEWRRGRRSPLSYRIQCWLLQFGIARAEVTVNGEYPNQPRHIHSFLNPCLHDTELNSPESLVRSKPGLDPVRLLFVGAMTPNKGVLRACAVLEGLLQQGIKAHLDIVGDGSERPLLESWLDAGTRRERVTLHGWQPRPELGRIYRTAHLILLPSETEGWPKVLSEAMAYGVVPIASAVSCIPQYLERFRVGRTAHWNDTAAFVNHAVTYVTQPSLWHEESQRAFEAAVHFTYGRYLQRVRALLHLNESIRSANP